MRLTRPRPRRPGRRSDDASGGRRRGRGVRSPPRAYRTPESAVYARLLMRRRQRSSSTVQPLCFTFSHRVVGPPTRSTADDVHRAGNAGVITSRYTPRSSSAPTGCQAALVPVWRTAREYLCLHFLADLTRHEWPVVSFRVAGRDVPLALVAPGQEAGVNYRVRSCQPRQLFSNTLSRPPQKLTP